MATTPRTKRRMATIGPPHTWPDDERHDWEERAAIMEFDGRLTTSEAEREAEALERKRHAAPPRTFAPIPPPRWPW